MCYLSPSGMQGGEPAVLWRNDLRPFMKKIGREELRGPLDTKSLEEVRGCQSLGIVGLGVEAFFISPGASSPMRVEETARDDAFPPGHNGSGSHRGHF